MLTDASPAVRELVVECRSEAMLGGSHGAITRIEEMLMDMDGTINRLSLLAAKAEILHMEGRDEEALELFADEIELLSVDAPEEVAIGLAFNRRDVTFSLFRTEDFQEVLDRSRLAEVNLWDYRAYHDVSVAAGAGKHYNALPVVWGELLRTYRQGCWQPYRAASRLMAVECLQLGWTEQAVYNAIVSRDEQILQQVGDYLLLNGTRQSLSDSVDALLACANLQRYFLAGCVILARMADGVPRARVNAIVAWLSPRLSMSPQCWFSHSVFAKAWDTLLVLAPQIDGEQAEAVVRIATEHEVWSTELPSESKVVVVRDVMIKSAGQLVDKLAAEVVDELVVRCLPLALERKQDSDYVDVVNLLCRLAEVGGNHAKGRIRDQLYGNGQHLNRVLMHVAEHFGATIGDREGLIEEAKRVAASIRLHVQRVSSDDEVQGIPGSYATLAKQVGDIKLVVHIADTMALESVLRHRHTIGSDELRPLIDAILAMILERENILSNKIGLISSIGKASDSWGKDTARAIFDVLSPISRGEFEEPAHAMSAAEAANPLNPFKVSTGKPSDFRGIAIYALACIDREQPGVFGRKLDLIVELGLTDLDPNIRTFTYAAAREKSKLSEAEFTALILGTRDPDEKAAFAAFDAIANKQNIVLKRPQWRLLIHSARLARHSRVPRVRRAAALACAKLAQHVSTTGLKDEFQEVLSGFADDTCYSVRSIVEAAGVRL